MSKFKVTDHVRVTHPNPLWFDKVGEVVEVDMLGGLYEFHVKIPGQASTWFNDDELILAESAPRKDMAEQEIDGERVRGKSDHEAALRTISEEIATEYIAARNAHAERVTAEDKLRLIADTVDAQSPAGSELANFRRRLSAILSIGHDA
jgi:hypothetical protein